MASNEPNKHVLSKLDVMKMQYSKFALHFVFYILGLVFLLHSCCAHQHSHHTAVGGAKRSS